MRNQRIIKAVVFLVLVLLNASCDSDSGKMTVTMKNGEIIEVDKKVRYYGTEDEFLHAVDFAFARVYDFQNVYHVDYEINNKYEILGYSQSFIGAWETATFGDWIKKYGLEPGTRYYVATKVYVQYVNFPSIPCTIVPRLTNENHMGYSISNMEARTFLPICDLENRVNIFTTGTRLIGYNHHGEQLDIETPNLNNIIWKFLVLEDFWQ